MVAALPLSLAGGEVLTLNSQKLIMQNGRVVAVGEVFANYGEYFLKADRVIGDERNGKIVAVGGVVLWDREQTIFVKADRMIYDTQSGVIELFNPRGRVKEGFFRSKHLTIRGKVYTFKTFCGSKCPDFQAEVCSRKFVYDDAEREGTLKDAVLKVEGKPILYSPWYPFLTRRKTGFLAPESGVDPFGNFFYRQPFFWAISPSSDATFTGDYRASKLYGGEVEFRKYFSQKVYLETLNAYYRDDAKGEYRWVGRDYYRKNRFLLSGKGFVDGWHLRWEYPSDKDLFYDTYFFEENLHYKSFAESYLEYWRETPAYRWNFKTSYFYNLKTTDRSKDLLIAPDFIFHLKQRPLTRGIYYDLFSSFTTFYRENRPTLRLQITPSLKFSKVFGTTPFTIFVKPYYRYYAYGEEEGSLYSSVFGMNVRVNSLLYDFDLVSTERWNFGSVWDWFYDYQPFERRDTAKFDYFDEDFKKNLFTLRAFNYLTFDGYQVAQFIFEQPYNFYNGYSFPTDGAFVKGHKLPFKLYYTLSVPGGRASWRGQIYYDHYLKKAVLNSQSLTLTPVETPAGKLSLSAGFVKSVNHDGEPYADQINYGLKASYGYWRLSAKIYYDRLISKNTRTTLVLSYSKECWSLTLNYQREFDRDLDRYTWSAFLTFSVFGRGINVLLGGGS